MTNSLSLFLQFTEYGSIYKNIKEIWQGMAKDISSSLLFFVIFLLYMHGIEWEMLK